MKNTKELLATIFDHCDEAMLNKEAIKQIVYIAVRFGNLRITEAVELGEKFNIDLS